MKLTLAQVVNAYAALGRIGAEKLPIKLAYTLQRNMRLLQPEAQQFEQTRVLLIKTRFGEKDGAENFTVPPNRIPAFEKQINELLSVEVAVDVHTVSLEEAAGIQISVIDMMSLDWMFTDSQVDRPSARAKKRKHT
jgi:hypothetical protein